MKEPVCNNCHQICNVRDIDAPTHDQNNNPVLDSRPTGESFCCRAGYQMLNMAEQIQREEVALRDAQRGVRI